MRLEIVILFCDLFPKISYLCIKIHQIDMNDYYAVRFRLPVPGRDFADLLADDLGQIGFESFVDGENEPVDEITGYVPAADFSEEAIRSVAPDVQFSAEFIEGQDWNEVWEKNYFQPIVVDGTVVVCSSFHTDVPQARYRITVNPKMAFGTGHHATTCLMMRAILERDCNGISAVDMGTGTGILAILMALRGAEHVLAVEIDPFAAENAVENVALNLPGKTDVVEIVNSDVTALDGRGECADLFLANINRNIITADVAAYAAAMRPGAQLVVSGFYVEDRPVVEAAAVAAGLAPVSADELDNWSSMTFIKPVK